ncbi:MAG: hypothetical protein EOM64_01925 [Erysipelotrichia bacterium]|nr:hypothetical protein [Erysipelotrichia bacterium]
MYKSGCLKGFSALEDNSIFRKESLERVSSPEQLNDYIKVSNSGVWMILIAIIVLLIGVFVWSFFSRLDTKLTASAQVTGRNAVCSAMNLY